MPSKPLKPSQTDLQPHSEKKVELLKCYLDAYFAILGLDQYTEAVHCFDLFCGEGVYPSGGEGSPLVILRNLVEASRAHPETQYHFLYNDKDKTKVSNVEEHSAKILNKSTPNLKVQSSNLESDVIFTLVAERLKRLKKEKAFIFFDPYGYRESKPDIIKSLLQGGKSEVLLWMPMQQMYRFSQAGVPDALADFTNAISFNRPFPRRAGIRDYIEFVRDGFAMFVPDCYVDCFALKKDLTTTYCMFFFTSHILGAEKMLDAKWKLDAEHGDLWSYTHTTSDSLFGDTPQVAKLKTALERAFSQGPLSNAEIYQITIRAGHKTTHAVDILTGWQKEGRLSKPDGERKGTFRIDYKSTFGSRPQLLTFNLK